MAPPTETLEKAGQGWRVFRDKKSDSILSYMGNLYIIDIFKVELIALL